ncbi:MAG: SAM-dependent methyltransferase [Candidatus Hydrogenedentota bacterium]
MNPTVTISSVAHGGYGIARIDGQVCFIPYALPGDEVVVQVERRSKGVLWGAIDRIVAPSPDRIDPGCGVYGRCGACTWLHFAYPAQAEWKRRIVRDCFERIAKLQVEVTWADDPDRRLHYRTRAEFHGDGNGFGFYAGGTHDVVDVVTCPLCHPRLNTVLSRLRELGLRGSVEVSVNPESDDVLVWSTKQSAPLASAYPNAQWIGSDGPRAQFRFDGVPVVNGAFSQSSLLLNRVLLRVVQEAVGDSERILDLYCGSGNLSLAFARDRSVVGIDHNRASIEAAQAAGQGEYRTGDETAFGAALGEGQWDAILLDPPRTGAKPVAGVLAECRAKRVVYVSCDPATLARDAKVLAAGGWKPNRVTAVDLFPNTCHIEAVCEFLRA